jgi:hypothetical protein
MRRSFRHSLYAAAAALTSACSQSGGAAPSGDSQLSFNIATRAIPAAAGAALAAPESYTDGAGNVLTFERVQLVLREVELENEAQDNACEIPTGDDDCAEVEIGPFLVDLPLGTPGAGRVFSAAVPVGTYDEVKFKIREPDDDAKDAAFIAAHPDFTNVTIRAEGSYNGAQFVFVSRLEAELKLDLVPPLVVGETATTDLTLLVDLAAWFTTASGTLIDPGTANQGGASQGLVNENIGRSFDAFEDHDHDGSDDHEADDDGPDDSE